MKRCLLKIPCNLERVVKPMEKSEFKTFDIFFHCQMSSQCRIQIRGKDTEYYCAMRLLNSSALVVCSFHRQENLSSWSASNSCLCTPKLTSGECENSVTNYRCSSIFFLGKVAIFSSLYKRLTSKIFSG